MLSKFDHSTFKFKSTLFNDKPVLSKFYQYTIKVKLVLFKFKAASFKFYQPTFKFILTLFDFPTVTFIFCDFPPRSLYKFRQRSDNFEQRKDKFLRRSRNFEQRKHKIIQRSLKIGQCERSGGCGDAEIRKHFAVSGRSEGRTRRPQLVAGRPSPDFNPQTLMGMHNKDV